MGYASRTGPWSRRDFIKAATPAAFAHIASRRAAARNAESGRVLAYVGSYTSAVDGGANGQGIYRFEMDISTGALTQQKLVAKAPNPSWIVIHPSRKYLYAVNEIVNQESGSVRAYAVEQKTG